MSRESCSFFLYLDNTWKDFSSFISVRQGCFCLCLGVPGPTPARGAPHSTGQGPQLPSIHHLSCMLSQNQANESNHLGNEKNLLHRPGLLYLDNFISL